MRGYVSAFCVPKAGATAAEYEDAVKVGPPPVGEGDFAGLRLCAAVADGASEAMLAGRWAVDLVTRFANAPPSADLTTVVADAVKEWDAVVKAYVATRVASGRPIQWYEEDGLIRGAFATIVGLRLLDTVSGYSMEGCFDTWALGDSCLFQVRGDDVVTAFPIKDAVTFGNNPDLVPSRPNDFSLVSQRIGHLRGRWRSGDAFYLATDALANWFLTAATVGEEPWKLLGDLGTEDGDHFETWVAKLRAAGQMRNDDTTLLRIDIH